MKLDNDTESETQSERCFKWCQTCRIFVMYENEELNCGWSETRQQHRGRNKANGEVNDVKILRNCETVVGVKLNNNTANTKQSERWCIWRQNLRSCHCFHIKNNGHTTRQMMTRKRRRIRRIFGNTQENEETITATLWLERRFDNNTGVRNRRKNRLEMFVQTGATLSGELVLTLGCVWYQKTSGLPIVGDSKTIHVSKSRPF